MVTSRERPILHGLIALVGVGLAVGLIAGGAVLVLTRGLGIGTTETTASDVEGVGESLYLPKPTATDSRTGPLISLKPGSEKSPASSPAATGITLVAGQASVAAMQQIDLTGSYPGGEGAVLRVQRFEGGQWRDFPVTASVTGGTFSTYIQTSQPGANRFRMADSDTGATSNEVVVTIG